MWYHLPGKENIADLPSRGCLPEELSSKRSNWINGPSWLSQEISTWPISKDINRFTNKKEKEFIKTEMQTSAVSTIIATEKKATISVENVIDPYRYSTLENILSVTATCLRFINNCHRKRQIMSGEISAEELNTAKKLWICDLQKTFSSSVEFNKRKKSLGVYEHEDGYFRCKGRLGRGKLPFDTKLPIRLPHSHHFTDLVIQSAHEKVYHNCVRQTLSEIRSKYWIPIDRQTVKRILDKCLLCRKLEGLPYPSLTVSDLPEFRVVGGRAFKAAGVDLCGPVYTKVHPKSKQMTKNFISITTCATSSMKHLEIYEVREDLLHDEEFRSLLSLTMGKRLKEEH